MICQIYQAGYQSSNADDAFAIQAASMDADANRVSILRTRALARNWSGRAISN